MRRPKLAARVREQLLAEIWSGHWRPGDQLPTEPELMRRFEVSRAPVREAMQSLHLLGIVDISPRRGAVLEALPVQSVIDLAILSGIMDRERSITDVFQFRHATEPAMARLAARHASQDELAALQELILENAEAVERDDRAAAQRIDLRLHSAIADASGNSVFRTVAAAMNGLFIEVRRATGGIPGASEVALGEHRRIVAAIERRDGRSAESAARAHIRHTQARYQAVRGGSH